MRKHVVTLIFAVLLGGNLIVHTGICDAQDIKPDKDAGAPTVDTAGKSAGENNGDERQIVVPTLPDCNSDQPKVYAPRYATLNISVGSESAWRPIGGIVDLHVSGDSAPVAANLLWYRACFRWHNGNSDGGKFRDAEPMRWKGATTDTNKDGNKVTINHFVVPVPDLTAETVGAIKESPAKQPHSWLCELWVLKRADIRVIAVDPRGGTVVDVTLPVRIIRVPFAVGVAVVVTILAFFVLWRFSLARGLKNGNFLLNIIATSKGYASLSQFQIMVWTLVTGAGAVYVISLSGNLIDLNSQILILLGITGATVIGSKLADDRGGSPSTPIAAAAAAPLVAVPPAAVPAVANGTPGAVAAPPRRPKWSDLVIIESEGPPEIDVTRVQMFLFTVISAGFVLIKVFGSYQIPDIPGGYVELMGISNGVYLTKKFVT